MRGRRGAVALGRYQLCRILRRAIAAQTASVSFSHRRCRHVGEREKLRKAQPREPEAHAIDEGKGKGFHHRGVLPPLLPPIGALATGAPTSPLHVGGGDDVADSDSAQVTHRHWNHEPEAEGGVPPSRASHQAMTKLETLVIIVIVRRYRPCLELLNNRCCCHELGIKGIPASNPAIATLSCQDSEKGKGWKRFEFDKDAPLEDEEIEVAEDDTSLARREEQIQAAHDKAMFGASALPPPTSTDSEPERENEKEVDKKAVVTSLLSETYSQRRLHFYLLSSHSITFLAMTHESLLTNINIINGVIHDKKKGLSERTGDSNEERDCVQLSQRCLPVVNLRSEAGKRVKDDEIELNCVDEVASADRNSVLGVRNSSKLNFYESSFNDLSNGSEMAVGRESWARGRKEVRKAVALSTCSEYEMEKENYDK
ncbi:hypothetical protein Ahy_A08g039121 isoform A [Arachis hypogaea]|uniref:Uncharacterized protein n=1 Tax=Arachis hypogaea TaxID=3818 RepID=A0A445BVA2_ARAHY|nr:hypothetical protein Ahy_A08g039121 isoform A [Arachis hypogaea]